MQFFLAKIMPRQLHSLKVTSHISVNISNYFIHYVKNVINISCKNLETCFSPYIHEVSAITHKLQQLQHLSVAGLILHFREFIGLGFTSTILRFMNGLLVYSAETSDLLLSMASAACYPLAVR